MGNKETSGRIFCMASKYRFNKLLNVREIKAVRGNYWKNSNVYSVLKRYAKRQAHLKRQSYTSEMNFSNMKFEWLKD